MTVSLYSVAVCGIGHRAGERSARGRRGVGTTGMLEEEIKIEGTAGRTAREGARGAGDFRAVDVILCSTA